MEDARSHRAEERALIKAESTDVGQERRDPYTSIRPVSPEERDSLSVMLRQYTYMVLKRRWLILGVALAFLILGGVKTLLQTPLYSATVRIQIEREPIKIVEGGLNSPAEANDHQDFLKTQYELLKSRRMAERVISNLHLHDDKSFLNRRGFSLLGKDFSSSKRELRERTARAIGIVLDNVTVSPVVGSRLVDVSFTDPSPGRARQIADGYAEAYVASNIDKRFEASSYAKDFLKDQIKQLKINLDVSERALLDFSGRERIVELKDKSSIAEYELSAASQALGQATSDRIKNEEVWQQVEKATAINIPQLLSNSAIDTLRGKRKDLETEYQEKRQSFKPDYPVMVQISNKIREIDRQLAVEVNAIKSSLKAAYDSSLAQENDQKATIEALKQEVLDGQKKGVQYNVLKNEADTNRGLYNGLIQRYKEVDIAGGSGTNNIFIVDPAELPTSPSEPKVGRALLLSLVLGLGAGVGMALLLERLDDRVRAPEEVEELTRLATLGVIPGSVSAAGLFHETLSDPRSAASEAYRSLSTALQFSTGSGLPRSMTVTSAGPGEGKSTTVLGIARYFSQIGLKVLIIDADLRKPSLHTKLGLSNTVGLSNYLTGASLPPEVIQKTDQPNLLFMASGPLPPNAADLLSGARLFSLISLGSEVFDLIVFDSPPLLGLADAQLLASASAATIFAVGAGEQRKGVIRVALGRLHMARATLIGAVLTKFDPKSVGYTYGYGYGYGSGYGYTGEGYSYSYGDSIGLSDQKRLGEKA